MEINVTSYPFETPQGTTIAASQQGRSSSNSEKDEKEWYKSHQFEPPFVLEPPSGSN